MGGEGGSWKRMEGGGAVGAFAERCDGTYISQLEVAAALGRVARVGGRDNARHALNPFDDLLGGADGLPY
jgi:hypothetical protein